MNSSQSQNNSPDHGQKTPPQQIFLMGFLGIIFIIVLIVSILILNRPQSESQDLPTDPQEPVGAIDVTPTTSPTSTISPTGIITFTPKPSRTPTMAPTSTATPLPTLIPSITPAFPSEFDDQYELVLWSPELADQLIGILEAYPETLSSYARGPDDRGFYDAYQYALFAQREALLRFPSATQANDWQWMLAYNLARTADQRVGEVYAELITQELNQGVTSPDELYLWGINNDPQLFIESYPLLPQDTNQQSYLIKVSAEENGSTYFWLIEESSGYKSYNLTSNFDFIRPNIIENFIAQSASSIGDLVGIFPTKIHESIYYQPPDVFSLFTQPPQPLPFAAFSPPAIGPDFVNNWQPIETNDGQGDIQFQDTIFPACQLKITHRYGWSGTEFVFLEDSYEISPQPELLSFCEYVVNHSINVWGPETTIQLMETILPLWPPETTTSGKDFPEDGLDEWLYRLSIYHALIGNQDQALEYSQTIVDNPSTMDSSWIKPATDLLTAYQTQRDIYRVCTNSIYCNPRLGFQSLIDSISIEEYSDLVNILSEAGVSVRTRGFFDFDNDGISEQWVIIRHQVGSPLEFWIISPNDTYLQSVFVTTITDNTPQLSYLEPIDEPPLVNIEPDFTFYYIKSGPEDKPIIIMAEQETIFASDRTEMEIDELEEMLLSGGDPASIQEELIILSKSPYFTCSFLLCPRFFYLLGLSSELANDEISAVSAYLDLWRKYLDHPFTTMARFKLESIFKPTPTQVPTITPTLGEPIGGTGTPIPTATLTPEGYPPPGYPPPDTDPTNTPPANPYPYP